MGVVDIVTSSAVCEQGEQVFIRFHRVGRGGDLRFLRWPYATTQMYICQCVRMCVLELDTYANTLLSDRNIPKRKYHKIIQK